MHGGTLLIGMACAARSLIPTGLLPSCSFRPSLSAASRPHPGCSYLFGLALRRHRRGHRRTHSWPAGGAAHRRCGAAGQSAGRSFPGTADERYGRRPGVMAARLVSPWLVAGRAVWLPTRGRGRWSGYGRPASSCCSPGSGTNRSRTRRAWSLAYLGGRTSVIAALMGWQASCLAWPLISGLPGRWLWWRDGSSSGPRFSLGTILMTSGASTRPRWGLSTCPTCCLLKPTGPGAELTPFSACRASVYSTVRVDPTGAFRGSRGRRWSLRACGSWPDNGALHDLLWRGERFLLLPSALLGIGAGTVLVELVGLAAANQIRGGAAREPMAGRSSRRLLLCSAPRSDGAGGSGMSAGDVDGVTDRAARRA